jgi:PD-(D/E)XK nuclease superfamily
MMKPNIFEIGTKELNQDAFLTWLLLYGDESDVESYSEDDKLVHSCGKKFIQTLLEREFPKKSILIKKVSAGRQWNDIDVWADINEKYLIIIEDKTFSYEHSNQLARYRKIAEDWCCQQNPPYEKPICIYLKTGAECLGFLKKVSEQGFYIFNRKHFIEILQDFPGIRNQIFVDFKERISRLDLDYSNFENVIIGEWNETQWIGFYEWLDSKIHLTDWKWVPNPAGGNWCAVMDWLDWNGFTVHLQIVEGRLCFKIGFPPDDIDYEPGEYDPNIEQDKWQNKLLKNAENKLAEIQRPRPYVHRGIYRTVACVLRENWFGKDQDLVDKDRIVSKLVKYEEFMKSCIK